MPVLHDLVRQNLKLAIEQRLRKALTPGTGSAQQFSGFQAQFGHAQLTITEQAAL